MQIAILVEQMRREGYEVLVSRPEVIYRKDEQGRPLEPIERLFVEIPKDAMGVVMENLSSRKAEISDLSHHGDQVSIEALMPMRGLIGFETDLVNQTRGLGVMSHLFHEYGPDRGDIPGRQPGRLGKLPLRLIDRAAQVSQVSEADPRPRLGGIELHGRAERLLGAGQVGRA